MITLDDPFGCLHGATVTKRFTKCDEPIEPFNLVQDEDGGWHLLDCEGHPIMYTDGISEGEAQEILDILCQAVSDWISWSGSLVLKYKSGEIEGEVQDA